MRKYKLAGLALITIFSSVALAQTSIQITASTIVKNIPAGYSPSFYTTNNFASENETAFPITASPITKVIPIEQPRDVQTPVIPALMLSSKTKGNIYYNCLGLFLLQNVGPSPTATIQFVGVIDPVFPWGGVLCVCSGSACSTSNPVSAQPLTQ